VFQLLPKLDEAASLERLNRCSWKLEPPEGKELPRYLVNAVEQFVKARKKSVKALAKVAIDVKELDASTKKSKMTAGSISAGGNCCLTINLKKNRHSEYNSIVNILYHGVLSTWKVFF
jgi:hypothetical protein